MQNFDAKFNRRTHGQMNGRMEGKTKTIYPSTYSVCQGYNKKTCYLQHLLSKLSMIPGLFDELLCMHIKILQFGSVHQV